LPPPFFKLSHPLVLHYAAKVKPAALIVYAGVLLHTNKNRQAWPSLRTIADMCGYRWCPAVSRALDELVDVGALWCQHQRRTTILFTFPADKFSLDKFTIITKDWLHEPHRPSRQDHRGCLSDPARHCQRTAPLLKESGRHSPTAEALAQPVRSLGGQVGQMRTGSDTSWSRHRVDNAGKSRCEFRKNRIS